MEISDVNYLNRRNVDSAIRKCGGVNATSGKVIAELSFGSGGNLRRHLMKRVSGFHTSIMLTRGGHSVKMSMK